MYASLPTDDYIIYKHPSYNTIIILLCHLKKKPKNVS